MSNENTPYIERNPGDLISAEDWNCLQSKVKEDIENQVKEGIDSVKNEDKAADADKLEGKTAAELGQEILDKVLAEIPSHSGYMKLFKVLKVEEENIIEHNLNNCPLVDVYQLDYFKVVCAVDDDKEEQWVNFYLYHTSEKKLKSPGGGESIEIELMDSQPYKIPLAEMLNRYNVPYTDSSSLGDLETELWKALFADPNDFFDPEQYCHSPWYERCCREERTVKTLKDRGDWDDLWFQMRPRKTINYPMPAQAAAVNNLFPSPAPTQITVNHYDFNTLGVTLLKDAIVQTIPPLANQDLPGPVPGLDGTHLKVMILLKV